MKKAGIKVWVLTGDKIETAVNIGFSAGLLDNNMIQHEVIDEEVSELQNTLTQIGGRITDAMRG